MRVSITAMAAFLLLVPSAWADPPGEVRPPVTFPSGAVLKSVPSGHASEDARIDGVWYGPYYMRDVSYEGGYTSIYFDVHGWLQCPTEYADTAACMAVRCIVGNLPIYFKRDSTNLTVYGIWVAGR